MNVTPKNYHAKMSERFRSCCTTCPFDKSKRPCKKEKTDCVLYNIEVAKYVLKHFPAIALTKIPAEHFVRGIQAHGYTGELYHTTEFHI